VALLGGLAVFAAEPGCDLLPGGSCGAGAGDELVLAEVEFAALGGDGAEGGQCPAGGHGPGGRQRDVDVEQRDGIERVSARGLPSRSLLLLGVVACGEAAAQDEVLAVGGFQFAAQPGDLLTVTAFEIG